LKIGLKIGLPFQNLKSSISIMKYSVITFGCRVNQADSLGFEEELRAGGAVAESPEQADLVIVNTCSVTASADQGARQTVRRIARINPHARIVVTGCYATRRPDEFQGQPHVLRVVRNDDKARLVAQLSDDVGLTSSERYGDGEGSCGAAIEPGVAGRTAFTLRVQTGCAQPCSYCIIPTTRGVPRSLDVGTVLSEVERVVAAGFKEIALTGVHLGSYGRDLTPASSLVELLRAIERRHGLKTVPTSSRGRPSAFAKATADRRSLGGGWLDPPAPEVRFRISSLEPMDCSREIVDLVASDDAFAPHFHLPLQHASDRLLTAMRRPYTLAYYADLVDAIRRRLPNASIGSDVIVGFPGETGEDFTQLCDYLARSPLTHLHVFPYSDRPGTAASAMTGKVHGAVTRERASRVREIGRRLTVRFRESQLGTVHRGLTIEDGTLVVTGNYLKVRIPPGCSRNEWVRVRVTDVGETMRGEIS
jgi:threonylcarbamoyladenosine tRNA methylthiotransferase MtaB